MKNLILVESPTKAKTLFKFLKGQYDIEASMGHVRDLPKSTLGVDVDHNFELKYVVPRDKRKIVEGLKAKVKDVENIILATDPDREGEAIAYHLKDLLAPEAPKDTKFSRIVFHEITQDAIDDAIKNPREIDQDLVSAQTARRVLDRIVGYKLSPLLWEKIKRNLSAGRVQSVALRLMVEREREIEKFKTEEYFRIFVVLSKKNPPVGGAEFELVEIDGEKVEVSEKSQLYDGEYKTTKTIFDKKKADEALEDLKKHQFEVINVVKRETRRSPYAPFITSTLQQEAARRLGFSGRKTMNFAQKLYEEGLITYHRTDSYNLSNQFINSAKKFIEEKYGKKYLPQDARIYKTKSKVAQEAHEAIRPTKVADMQNEMKKAQTEIGRDGARLYELIYKRALASQMSDALFELTKVSVTGNPSTGSGGSVYLLEKAGSVLLFDGFLKLWFYPPSPRGEDTKDLHEENDSIIPEFESGEKLSFNDGKITEHSTAAPPRYNEASLVGSLEKNGIGRPSTYASIVSTIEARHYIERLEGRFAPTGIGKSVNDFLVKNFSAIDDIPFTAKMEDALDAVANGEIDWVPMMKDFYGPFDDSLIKAQEAERVEVPVEKTDKKCPACGSDLVIRYSKFGKFYACSKYPECKYTASFFTETNEVCPDCASLADKDESRRDGKIVVRRTRRGRVFFGCSNYPKCKFAVWKLDDLKKDKSNTQNPSNKSGLE